MVQFRLECSRSCRSIATQPSRTKSQIVKNLFFSVMESHSKYMLDNIKGSNTEHGVEEDRNL